MTANPKADTCTDMSVFDAIAGRKSVRCFRPDPVRHETIRAILDIASRSPSGTNTQPWKVYVVEGAIKQRISNAVIAASEAGETSPSYQYGPDKWAEPYLSRRRTLGYGLYDLLGIAKDDYDGRKSQHHENYRFFGAPVGLFFTIDAQLVKGSWLDMGMLLTNIMLAARGFGLETCPQAAWVPFAGVVGTELGLPDDEVLVCGMSMGYADWDARVNELQSERAPVDEFTTFLKD